MNKKIFNIHIVIYYIQKANLVLQATVERIFLPSNGGGKDYRNSTRSSPTSSSSYADLYLGMFVIRGENVVLLGEIVKGGGREEAPGPWPISETHHHQNNAKIPFQDEEQEKAYLATLAKVDPKQARDQVKREREERRERETARLKALVSYIMYQLSCVDYFNSSNPCTSSSSSLLKASTRI